MNKQLKEAQYWEEEFLIIKSFLNKDIHKGFAKIRLLQLQEIAKVNMEKLGCGKSLKEDYGFEKGYGYYCNITQLCPDCQKAKEIYERNLNRVSEELVQNNSHHEKHGDLLTQQCCRGIESEEGKVSNSNESASDDFNSIKEIQGDKNVR